MISNKKVYLKYLTPHTVQHMTSAFNANADSVTKACLEIPDILKEHKYKINEVLVSCLVTATAILISADQMIEGADDSVEQLKKILEGLK